MTTLKESIYTFDERVNTWSELHESKKKYTSTGWLCGVEVATMDEPVRKIDEFLFNYVTPRTILIPDNLALYLYNKSNDGAEFEGQTYVRSIRRGLGEVGTKKEYKFEDGYDQILTGLHEKKWHKCEADWFYHTFCTESQFQMIQHVFGRVPGVMYI
jgi:hypothetical protein